MMVVPAGVKVLLALGCTDMMNYVERMIICGVGRQLIKAFRLFQQFSPRAGVPGSA